jgi:hypothetical protein
MKKSYYSLRRNKRRRGRTIKLAAIIAGGALVLAVGIYFLVGALFPAGGTGPSGGTASQSGSLTASAASTPSPSPTPEPTLSLDLVPAAIEGETDPGTFGFETHIYVDDVEVESFAREGSVSFSSGEDYNALEGITTYRGNNYRDTTSSYGTADITDGALAVLPIDKTTRSMGTVRSWSGSACTGQPLIVTWPEETRRNMTSLYEEFRSKEGFTEVIMGSVDGSIYFMELSTGAKTRNPIETGAPIKGTPSLDPRGWPIIYAGQGLHVSGDVDNPRDMYFRVFSLIDGSLLYKFGYSDRDPAAYRKWQAYDASPLVDAATDTLVWPGESGVLYTIKLNTVYDAAGGTVGMQPGSVVKYTYTTPRNQQANGGKGAWGMENSAVGWRNYLMFTDNIGMLQCVDLNTMALVYANDLSNDSDVSMVLEEDIENQDFYLYTGCEFDDTVVNATSSSGTCYARKIDGLTGHIMWTTPFNVYTAVGGSVDGGILGSPILGQEGTTMEGLIIYTVSSLIREDGDRTAMVVALDKEDGHIVWQVDMENAGWTPASPAAVYTADGQGYIVQCLYKGTVKLIKVDGAFENGASVADSVNVSEAMNTTEPNSFEATPAVFGNTVVVGSRSGHFFFLRIN